jgi:nucleotidyltransferase substrate binding protein (TIGR01987 family)
MFLDYTTLENAIIRLEEGIKTYEKYKEDKELKETVRDSLVKRFEFTFEHSLKMMARNLKEQGFNENDLEPRKQLLRTARDQELIKSFEQWNKYIKSRNITSHEYQENSVADQEYIDLVMDFYTEVKILLKNMKEIEL